MSAAIMEINIPAGASEVTLKTAGKYCDKNIRVNTHFRIESGAMSGASEYITDYIKNGAVKGKTITIPCSPNPKLIIFKATQNTQERIASLTADATFSGNCAYAIIFNNIIDLDEAGASAASGRNCLLCQFLLYESNNRVYSTYSDGELNDMDTAPKTNVGTFYTGDEEFDAEYEWTAYYWDE